MIISIEAQLTYNFVLIYAIQQNDSIIHVYIIFFILFSIMVFHGIMHIVPYAI